MKVGETRVYVVPLRKGWLRTPVWRRTKRSVKKLKDFILKHTKAEKVVLSRWVNEALWEKGGKNPLSKLKVKVTLQEDIIDEKTKATIKAAHVELDVLPPKAKRVKKKEEKKKTIREKIKAKFAKKEEEIPEEKPKEEKEKAKITKKQELAMNK